MEIIDGLSAAEKKRIQVAVIKCFELYRIIKFGLDLDKGSTVYSNEQILNFHGYCKKVEDAVNKLADKEKVIITERYLHPDSDYIKDYTVYKDLLKISNVIYSKYRNRAMIKLAKYLEIDSGLMILSNIQSAK